MKTPEETQIEFSEKVELWLKKNLTKQSLDRPELHATWTEVKYMLRSFATSQIEDLTKEVEKLSEFKRYVHDRLDKIGIPSDPEPESNASHGCRIEGRLNFVTKEVERLKIELSNYAYQIDRAKRDRDKAESSNDRYREALEDCVDRMKRARKILTGFSKEPNSWQMLNAEKYESLLHPLAKEGE